jgi:nicotinamidase-related amidase
MLELDDTALVVVDLQEAFRTAIDGFAAVLDRCTVLARAATILGIPTIVTEQYPDGLGATVPELSTVLEGPPALPKLALSAARADGFDLGGRGQVVVCGIETHICVHQTAADLVAQGHTVHVPADAVGSRHASDHTTALARLPTTGATVTSTEMVLFELVRTAADPRFRELQRLIR